MAETPQQPKSKRIVKNPETFRERAIKATTEGEKPQKKARIRSAIRAIFLPIGTAIRKFFALSVFKPLRTPAHILGKILLPVYFRKSWQELKLVTWPSFRESMRLTYAVLIFAIVFGISVAVIDYGLDVVFKKILLK